MSASGGRIFARGDLVDRYRVLGTVGQGGMADVLHVEHADLGTEHALKVLRVVVPGLHERLLQEGRIQATLRHPNIVAVTDVVRVDGTPGLVMELVRGPALDALIRRYQPSPPQADALARGMLAGMAAAHDRGLIHRDLKPGNVLIAVEGDRVVPKITDFGLAKAIAGDVELGNRTRSGATMGTPAFMAPEQFRNARLADHRSDVFALGAILYELVSGVPAFDGDDLIALYEQTSKAGYRPLREVAPQVPERMERAVVAALQPDPDARPQSVEDLLLVWADGTPEPKDAWEPAHLRLVVELAPGPDSLTGDTALPGDPTPTPELTESRTDAPLHLPLEQPPVRRGGRETWLWIALLAALGVGVLGLALAATVVGGVWWSRPPETAAVPVAVPAPPPVPEPSPSPSPEPVQEPVPPGPSRPHPAPVPEPSPAPTPGVPAPAPLGADGARVTLEGAPRGFLVDRDSNERRQLGAVPAGAYHLYVSHDGGEPVRVMLLRLEPGEHRTVRCAGAFCQ